MPEKYIKVKEDSDFLSKCRHVLEDEEERCFRVVGEDNWDSITRFKIIFKRKNFMRMGEWWLWYEDIETIYDEEMDVLLAKMGVL